MESINAKTSIKTVSPYQINITSVNNYQNLADFDHKNDTLDTTFWTHLTLTTRCSKISIYHSTSSVTPISYSSKTVSLPKVSAGFADSTTQNLHMKTNDNLLKLELRQTHVTNFNLALFSSLRNNSY